MMRHMINIAAIATIVFAAASCSYAAANRDGQVHVLGSVARPGKIPYEAEMTIGDALKKAGGSNGLGSLGKIVVKRTRDRGVETAVRLLKVTLEERFDGRGPKLQPGDIVIVHP